MKLKPVYWSVFQKRTPIAFELFYQWISTNENLCEYDKECIENDILFLGGGDFTDYIYFSKGSLYDFFDQNNVNVKITPEYYLPGPDEETAINWNFQLIWYEPRETWRLSDPIHVYDFTGGTGMYGDNNEYPTRKLAEQAAFTKAFEELEKRLTGRQDIDLHDLYYPHEQDEN